MRASSRRRTISVSAWANTRAAIRGRCRKVPGRGEVVAREIIAELFPVSPETPWRSTQKTVWPVPSEDLI